MSLKLIIEADERAQHLGHVPLEDLRAPDARTVMKNGLDYYIDKAFMCVVLARKEFARDGDGDPLASDLDQAIRHLTTAAWFLRGEDE